MDEENEYESSGSDEETSDEETSSVIEHDVSDEEVPEYIQYLNSHPLTSLPPVSHNPHNGPQLEADVDVIMEEAGGDGEEMDVDEGGV
jgi:hypothetical protein